MRPKESNREVWGENLDNLNKCVLALTDDELNLAYLPGVAEQCVWIIDLECVGLMDITSIVPSIQNMLPQLTDNYPSRGGTFFVVNAGYALGAAVNAVLLFAQEESRQKTQVFAAGFGEYAEEYFNLAELPVEYGGQATIGHPEENGGH